jgi:hypothetical protein
VRERIFGARSLRPLDIFGGRVIVLRGVEMRVFAVVASLAVLAAPAAFAQEAEGETPASGPPPGLSLTGQWTLDPARSDDPKQKVRDAVKGIGTDDSGPVGPVRPPTTPGRGGTPRDPARGEPAPTGPGVDVMTPGVAGVGGSDDPFHRRSSGSGRSEPRAAYEFVLDLPETVTIAQRPSLILIQEDDDEGRVRGLHPDGSRRRGPLGATETRWEEEGRLRVKTWRDDGVDVDETFELAADRSQLTVTVRVAQGGVAMTLERVFVPDESED